MRKLFLFITVWVFSLSLFSQTEPYDISRLYTNKLSNGMTLIYYRIPDVSYSSLYLGFNAGSRYDEIGFEGESKLLEKLAFKGTAKIGSKNIAEELRFMNELEKIDEEILTLREKGESNNKEKEIDELIKKALLLRSKVDEQIIPRAFENVLYSYGAKYYYARSTPDFFEIGITFPKDFLEEIISLEGDFFVEPVFRNFYDERYNLFQEASSIQNASNSENYKRIMKSAFGEKSSDGIPSSIQKISLKQFKDYFKKALNPKYGVIVISGNYEWEKVFAVAEKYFGKITSDSKEPLMIPDVKFAKSSYTVFSDEGISIAFKKENISSQSEAAIDLIANYLTGGEKPLLQTRISDKIKSGNFLNGDPGLMPPSLLIITLKLKEGSDAESEAKKTTEFFLNFNKMNIDSKSFEQARKRLLFSIYLNSERSGNIVRQIGEGFLLSKESSYFFDYVKSVKTLSLETIKNISSKIFINEKEEK
ncbi:MAG: M16 family metallopeptidase [Acidobacteriota bacterium]